VVEVSPRGLEIGRAEDADLPLPEASSVSKRHARIYWDRDDLLVDDLGSTNGVRRDGLAVPPRTVLDDGDELVLGEVVLRVSLTGTTTLVDVHLLDDTSGVMLPRRSESGPMDVERRAAEILPIVEQFFHARDVRDLATKVVEGVKRAVKVSRCALVEIEENGQRLRGLAVDGAKDIRWVSRTVVAEAMKRGIALHQLGAVGRPMSGSLVDARSTTAVGVMVRTAGDRVRILYADTLTEHLANVPPLTWRHAFELQMFATSAASAFEMLGAQLRQSRDRLRFEHLKRYFSPALVEQLSLVTRPEEEFLAPAVVGATVLFADLSGLTRLTERWRGRPQALVSLLDLWFELGSRAVFAQGGTLDKFIGDGIMAVFGAPFPVDQASLRALHCAGDMQRAVAQLARDTGEPLALTVAFASGPVLSMYTGSRRRREFTVLGETVTRAAKLREGAQPGEILCDEPAAAELAPVGEFEIAGQLPGSPPQNVWRFLRARA
jgi:adenylate cyclase